MDDIARKPLGVYAVVEKDGKDGQQRSFWVKVGAAFANRDGSTTLLLDAFPIGTNKLQVREPREWEPRPAGGGNGHPEARP